MLSTGTGRLLAAYWTCAALHLVTIATGPAAAMWVTKAALMPVLIGWVLAAGGPRLLVGALAASLAGDVLLLAESLLVPGMVMFAVAHGCYVVWFVRRRPRRRGWVITVYAVVWAAMISVLWSGLAELRLPVAAYALLLMATAVTAGWNGLRTGVGGAIFVVSDGLIAVGLAGHDFAGRDLLVMATYVVAQFLLASGMLRLRAVGESAGADRDAWTIRGPDGRRHRGRRAGRPAPSAADRAGTATGTGRPEGDADRLDLG